MRPARRHHAPGHRPAHIAGLLHRQAQQLQFADQFRQDQLEALPRPLHRGIDGLPLPVCADDEIDRSVLEVPAAVAEAGARWRRFEGGARDAVGVRRESVSVPLTPRPLPRHGGESTHSP